MRVLFTTQPGVGHLHPLVPLAHALQGVGHAVAVACAPSFRDEVTRVGLRAFPAGRDWLTSDLEVAFPALRAIPPGPERYIWVRTNIFADATAREAVPDLLALARAWSPDLIVREAAEYGGCLAAELLGLPHATVRTDAGSASDAGRALVAAPLAAARARFGLPPDPENAMPFRFLRLSFAGALDDPVEDIGPTTHRLRPPATETDPSDMAALRDWHGRLPGRPLVYATLGTVYNRLEGVLAAILDALRPEGLNVILTVGRGQDPARLGPQPPHIRVERFLAQAILLPECDLVVTHGGYGTVAAALAHGVPLVLIPISADQPGNARRCAALGVGRAVGPEERTPAAIRAAARAVMGDPTYRRNALALRDTAATLPGLDHAVALLERLAVERQPLLAPPAPASVTSRTSAPAGSRSRR